MNKRVFLNSFAILVLILLTALVSFGLVPDSDHDGVPDDKDQCPNSQTTNVDQFGCSCEQRNCLSDGNPCTDDCGFVNGVSTCRFTNNNALCPEGYCSNGVCHQNTIAPDAGEITGELEVIHKDDFKNPENSKYIFYLRRGNERYELGDETRFPVMKSGAQVSINGQISGKKINIKAADSSMRVLSSAPANNENLGPQSTLVIVARVDGQEPSADINTARDLVFGDHSNTVNDFYKKNSLGKASLTGKLVGPYNLPPIPPTSDVLFEAIKAADPEVNFRDYSRIILDIPNSACFGYGGFGTIGKSTYSTADGDIRASVSWDCYFSLFIVGHELGHNFGTRHANRMDCFDCQSYEYGDSYDIMGSYSINARHFNAPHKEEAGWLDGNVIIATEGEYLIKPLESRQPLGSIQQIKLPLSVKPRFYDAATNVYTTLEFRQPTDYDAGAPSGVYSGVFVHLAGDYRADCPTCVFQTNLINYDRNDFLTPLLQIGETFKDYINGYEVTLKDISANGALVSIKKLNPNECYDSDGGLNYNLSGIVAWLNYTYIDYCADSEELVEYYCKNNESKRLDFKCPDGCKDGACIATPKPPFDLRAVTRDSLNDTRIVYLSWSNVNGEAFNIYRSVNDEPFSRIFKTTEKSYKEEISKQKKYGYYVTALNKYGESKPSNYVYVYPVSNNTCTDSDGGKNYDVKGETASCPAVGEGVCFAATDFCWNYGGVTYGPCEGGNGCVLVEHYCNSDGTIGKTTYDCPKGCKDGACTASNTPVFSISCSGCPYDIHNGDTVTVTVTNGLPNKPIYVYVEDSSGKKLMDGNEIGQTDSNGKWSYNYYVQDWLVGDYKVKVIVAGAESDWVSFTIKPSIHVPVFDVNPKLIHNGDTVFGNAISAEKNSAVLLYVRDMSDGSMPINGQVVGQTDNNGQWSTSMVDDNWKPSFYSVWVTIAGTNSNTAVINVV